MHFSLIRIACSAKIFEENVDSEFFVYFFAQFFIDWTQFAFTCHYVITILQKSCVELYPKNWKNLNSKFSNMTDHYFYVSCHSQRQFLFFIKHQNILLAYLLTCFVRKDILLV
jgi:hypothetical protein